MCMFVNQQDMSFSGGGRKQEKEIELQKKTSQIFGHSRKK